MPRDRKRDVTMNGWATIMIRCDDVAVCRTPNFSISSTLSQSHQLLKRLPNKLCVSIRN